MQWHWEIDGWIVLTGLLSACSCALLGNYLVLRRMSLMGDAISHAVLPGIALAFLVTHSRASWPIFLGAVLAGTLTALLTQVITRYGKVEHGAAMGVVFSALFAAGLILIRRGADHVDLDPGCVLYGNIVGVPMDAFGGSTPPAVINLSIVMVAVVLFVALFYKELKISAFDPDLATTLGINASLMHYLLMIMVAVTTVACFESVGSILVIAMLIVPPAAAHLLTDRMGVMVLLSFAIGAASAVLGHVTAIAGPGWLGMDAGMDVNPAPMMAVMTGAFFVGAFLFSPHHGLIARWIHRVALSAQIIREDVLGLLYRWQEMRGADSAMTYQDLITALQHRGSPRRALRKLMRRRLVRSEVSPDGSSAVALTPAGLRAASGLIRAHRLWESYVARHFDLPLDHLHMPAERMEHHIDPNLREQLEEVLAETQRDPHGRRIPKSPNGPNGTSTSS